MNEMLLNLLAAQANASGNPGIAGIMARMQAMSQRTMDPQELIAQMGGNPVLESMARQMVERQEAAKNAPVIDMQPAEEQEDPATAEQQERDAAFNQLSAEAESLRGELRLVRERNDLLAAALGACCLCWGMDLHCRSCRGRGGPGFSMPDESLFDEYVLPAVQTFRAQKLKFRKPPCGAQPEYASSELRSQVAGKY